MAYDIKDVFYLDTQTTIAGSTANGGSAQLDLSAYIDPIARGRQKGTGLAVYKTWYTLGGETNGGRIPLAAETGSVGYGLIAGLGLGDIATGGYNDVGLTAANNLLVSSGWFYGQANPTFAMQMTVEPSEKVPYVIVRDNVCLVYEVGDQFDNDTILAVRLECAQISLDQATLNQLLRTQTV